MQLLIPSAKVVPPELQRLGRLPSVIYPIHNHIVLDLLVEKYKRWVSKIYIMCYEQAELVDHAVKKYDSDIIKVSRLDQLRDIGYTVYKGLKLCSLDEPVIINFGDVVIEDVTENCSMDCYFYARQLITENWTYFEESDGRIESIRDKEKTKTQQEGSLFTGLFIISNPVFLKTCLKKYIDQKQKIDSFYRALIDYSHVYPMQAVLTEKWLDIGHIDNYYRFALEVSTRAFNQIVIDKERGILKKTSGDKEKFRNEILWYLKLPAEIEYVSPRIFSYSLQYEDPFVEMEYYAYHTIHELFLYGDLSYEQWKSIFHRIRFICNDFNRYSVTGPGIKDALEDMYLRKTIERLNNLKKDSNFSCFFERGFRVNGISYPSLEKICGLLQDAVPEMLYDVERFPIIHGDLCFTNIMSDSNFTFIKVIDPRGKFGKYDLYGDFRYELAKLFHSIHGKYDYIIKDLFHIEIDLKHASVIYEISDRSLDYNIFSIFLKVFEQEIGQDLKKIEFIEALLFLSMISLHNENLKHQYAMLATGIEILDSVLKIRINGEEGNDL